MLVIWKWILIKVIINYLWHGPFQFLRDIISVSWIVKLE